MYSPYSSTDAGGGADQRRQLWLRWTALKQERVQWWDTWQELGSYLLPDSVRFYQWDRARAGQRQDDNIINSSPVYAVRVLAAGMMSGITSPARPWFRITTPNPNLADKGPVREWLGAVEDRIRMALVRSNIYKQLSKLYYDLPVFGQVPLMIEEDPDDLIRATLYPIGAYALATNARGQVDTMFRECGMSVRQMVQKFGVKACSPLVQTAYKNPSTREKWIDMLQCVMPRSDEQRAAGTTHQERMKYRSVWIEQNDGMRQNPDDALLLDSGYEECPFMAPRWETTAENVYGTNNPGRHVLGDVKQLQLMESRKLQLIEKLADPPMQAPSSMRMERIQLMPGDINYVPGNAQQKFMPAYEMHPQALQGLRAEIQAVEQRIQSGFYADLWLMFSEADSGQPITAKEVAERHEEKMLQLGPVMENLEDELLDPIIDRVFGILWRQGYIPPAPPELQGSPLRIEYISMMAQAQKLLGTSNIERLLATAGSMAAGAPSVLDNVDLDETVRTLADMYGVPPKIIRTKDQVAKLRAMKQQQQADAQRAEMMANAAQGAKVLSQADMTNDNALTRLTNNAGPIVAGQRAA